MFEILISEAVRHILQDSLVLSNFLFVESIGKSVNMAVNGDIIRK